MRVLLSILSLFAFIGLSGCLDGQSKAADRPEMMVYKTPTCGCCKVWIEHLEENGFRVETKDVVDVTPYREGMGVPARLGSCHTAIVDGYVVEGHVPAEDVKRMLETTPEIVGISVPGMPIGSPGMEVPGREADKYQVIAFDKAGNYSVYAEH